MNYSLFFEGRGGDIEAIKYGVLLLYCFDLISFNSEVIVYIYTEQCFKNFKKMCQ